MSLYADFACWLLHARALSFDSENSGSSKVSVLSEISKAQMIGQSFGTSLRRQRFKRLWKFGQSLGTFWRKMFKGSENSGKVSPRHFSLLLQSLVLARQLCIPFFMLHDSTFKKVSRFFCSCFQRFASQKYQNSAQIFRGFWALHFLELSLDSTFELRSNLCLKIAFK
jgi:hypothetical protein